MFFIDLMSGLLGLTSGLSLSKCLLSSRLIFKLVPMLKLDDDTNILLLYRVSHKKGIDKKLLFGAAQGLKL